MFWGILDVGQAGVHGRRQPNVGHENGQPHGVFALWGQPIREVVS
jgi:hypothetical protein